MSAKELGIGSEMIDAREALAKIGVEVPNPNQRAVSGHRRTELPMPRMPEEV
jgi:hypothetical protein